MFRAIKVLSLSVCAAFVLQGCGGDGDNDGSNDSGYVPTVNSPKQVLDLGVSTTMASLRAASPAVEGLFTFSEAIATASNITEKCSVKLHKMTYDTINGAGGTTTSTGVAMVPYGNTAAGDSASCNDPRPILLYAHGTATDRSYDLSKLTDSANPAASESAILLAFYASKGYNVVAPNYAGYAESALSYHPFLDEVQQSTEMIDALNHFKTHASNIGANVSSKLFLTGLSQGGYVAMATQKALQAKGETVTASLPISGPYAMLDFLDTIIAGYVNGGATVFAPMYLTSAQKRDSIYTSATEVYSSTYAANAENSLPRTGGFTSAVTSGVLPQNALFNIASIPTPVAPAPPLNTLNTAGFGTPFLLADSFRTAYLTDAATNGATPQYKVRQVVKNADLRTTWSPTAPVFMCGSAADPVVYHSNSDKMKAHMDGLNNTVVTNIELSSTASGTPAAVQTQWNTAVAGGTIWATAAAAATVAGTAVPAQPTGSISPADVHGQTGVYCSAIALGLFNGL